MIRPSDKGPGKAHPPRTKQPRGGSTPPPSSGEKKGWWPCSIVIAVPALTLLAACAVVTLHGP